MELFLVEAVIETLTPYADTPPSSAPSAASPTAPPPPASFSTTAEDEAAFKEDGATTHGAATEAHATSPTAVDRLKYRVDWTDEYFEAGFGLSLLHIAAFLGDEPALRELLASATPADLNRPVAKGMPGTLVMSGVTPIIFANLSASPTAPPCVTLLLEAGVDADPSMWKNDFMHMTAFSVPFTLPAGVQPDGSLAAWLAHRPEDAHSSMRFPLCESMSVLATAAQKGNQPSVERLLASGAKPEASTKTVSGRSFNILHQILQPDIFATFRATFATPDTLRHIAHALPASALNEPSRPATEHRRQKREMLRRFGTRLPPLYCASGVTGVPFGGPWGDGFTPMHHAVLLVEPELCAVLRQAGADPHARTSTSRAGRVLGWLPRACLPASTVPAWLQPARTPLQLARVEFGPSGRNPMPAGVLAMLEEALSGDERPPLGSKRSTFAKPTARVHPYAPTSEDGEADQKE